MTLSIWFWILMALFGVASFLRHKDARYETAWLALLAAVLVVIGFRAFGDPVQ
jgi:hypothetical protein